MQLADHSVPVRDKPRLTDQCNRILEILRNGRATNKELAAVAMKYTSRISDLRKNGHDVRMVERREGGITVYELFPRQTGDQRLLF
jgi:DNA-binding CsgD family transcriptional regulator